MGNEPKDHAPKPFDREDILLWIGLFAGPAAFSVDLVASYAVVSFTAAEDRGQHGALYAITAFALLATLVALGLARGLHRRATVERRRFMALGGVMMSAFFAIVILAEAIPKLLLRMGQ